MSKKKILILSASFILISIIVFTTIALINSSNIYAANVTTYSYKGNDSFFEEIYDPMIPDNDASIDLWFDTLEPTGNITNFASSNTAVYQNINNKTVYVDSFSRYHDDSYNDPNFGQGMLIYEAIEYKIAHPEEEVYIDISTYRLSVTASVCLKRNSKYFGYMRSLFECEYDQHGFIRISFMLAEAARMGIHVIVIPHLNSYGVRQYSANSSTKYASRGNLSYETYFTNCMNVSCYEKYTSNKKISDFLTYSKCFWLVNENGSTDMMHTKTCAVSAYRDYQGNDFSSGVFFTSSNIDENDYLGRNGNNGSQTGVIISNHDEIYNVVHNYVSLLKDYCGAEEAIIFRDMISKTNKKQFDAYYSGTYDDIPLSERIVYLGSETDNVFEMYFTPLAGSVGVWDKAYNPYSKYFTEFAKSDDYIELTWAVASYSNTNVFARTLEDLIYESYHKNLNPNNKIVLSLPGFEKGSQFNDLIIDENIGYRYIGSLGSIHSKDTILSYSKDGIRNYVSIITSCNYHLGALYYQSNQFLIIKETDDIGHSTYDFFKHAISVNRI